MTTIRLTFEVSQEADLPNQWLARCVELDVLTAALSPEVAFEALAEAVRMTVQSEASRRGVPTVEAFAVIADEAAKRGPAC
jgi:hypothetical protein